MGNDSAVSREAIVSAVIYLLNVCLANVPTLVADNVYLAKLMVVLISFF